MHYLLYCTMLASIICGEVFGCQSVREAKCMRYLLEPWVIALMMWV